MLGTIRGIKRKVRIHILGAGSPILLVLTGLFVPHVEAISIDSTAPFMDSDDGIIYGHKSAFLKMKMERVAAYHLINGSSYSSNNPFWLSFNSNYPSNWDMMRKKLNVTADTDYKMLAKKIKASPELVEKYIPYFSKMRGGGDKLIKHLRIARAGSNYWVIKKICDRIRYRIDDNHKLMLWVEREVDRYSKIAHPKWAKAVREVFNFSKQI
jgi:hypothetical protein